MAKTSSLSARLANDFPELTFAQSDDFYWSSPDQIVYLAPLSSPEDKMIALHETAHGLLAHTDFVRDIDLLRIEREAWAHAISLAPRYDIVIDETLVEEMLDTYREWLHARSTCPNCSLTGIQSKKGSYRCLGCAHTWRVNDARRCGLKRYSTP